MSLKNSPLFLDISAFDAPSSYIFMTLNFRSKESTFRVLRFLVFSLLDFFSFFDFCTSKDFVLFGSELNFMGSISMSVPEYKGWSTS